MGPRFRTITVGFHDYDLYLRHERIPRGARRLTQLEDRFHADQFVARARRDFSTKMLLDRLLVELPSGVGHVPLWEGQIHDHLATAFARGWLVAVVHEPKPLALLPLAEEEEPEEEAVAKDNEPFRCSVQIVLDTTDDPLPDIKLSLRLADGTEVEVKTDSGGLAELDDAVKGSFGVTGALQDATMDKTYTFVKSGALPSSETAANGDDQQEPPPGTWIARVKAYRVRTGDTLESIAAAHGTTADRLAYFNWSSIDEAEINSHLHYDVGCTVTEEDGKTYVLDDSDTPGIIYVPQPWAANGLPHDQTYIVRVRPLQEPVALLFST